MLPNNAAEKRRSFLLRMQQGGRSVSFPNITPEQEQAFAAERARSSRITRQTGMPHPPYRSFGDGLGWGERSGVTGNVSNLSNLRAQNRTQSAQRLKDVKSDAFKGKLFAMNDMRMRLSQSQSMVLAFVSFIIYTRFSRKIIFINNF